MESLHVAIVGAGVGGLALARALQCKGIGKVTIFERSPELRARGGHIAIMPAALNGPLSFLEDIGVADPIWECCVKNSAVRHMSNGKLLVEIPFPDEYKIARITRESLVEILAESLHPGTLRFGSVVTGFSEKPDSVQVMFKDGPAEEFDILVGADGINSAISAALFPDESKPSYAGFVTYVALAPGITIPDPNCYQEFFGTTRHGIGARVTGIAGGGRNSSWDLISVTVREADVVTNEWDNEATAKETRQILEDMGDSVPSWTLDVVDRAERIWKWGMFEHAQKRAWVSESGRVAILGDAAHAMVPYLGMGANSALMDAMVLSKELTKAMESSCSSESIRAALIAYETERKETCEALVKDSRHKGTAMTATGLAASVRDATFKLDYLGKKLNSSPSSFLQWCGHTIQAIIASAIDTADTYSRSNGYHVS